MRRADLYLALAVFAVIFVAFAVSPVASSGDSRWAVPTAMSLLHHGDLDLNEYLPLLEENGFYAIECIGPSGERTYPIQNAAQCAGGHLYTIFPLAVPLLSSAVIGPMELGIRAAQPVLAPLAERASTGVRRALLQGDFVAAHAAVELLVASVFVALAAALTFLLAREFLARGMALSTAALFAFCTSAWSVGSRNLGMHGFSMLLLTVALWGVVRARRDARWWYVTGAAVSLAYFVRPTNAIAAAVIAVLAWHTGGHALRRLALGAAPVAAAFVAINLMVYGMPLSPYELMTRSGSMTPGGTFADALAGNWLSPARGLLVYSPVLIFAFAGLLRWWRMAEWRGLAAALAAIIVLHWLVMSSFSPWWAGYTYGPRYFSDVLPAFLLLTIAWLAEWRNTRAAWRAAFLICAALSFFLHAQGAWCAPCAAWNGDPASVDSHPERIWDWRDPAFLRGFR